MLKLILLNIIFLIFIKSTKSQIQQLTNDEITTLASANDHEHFENVLDQILQPRIAGTPEHEVVKDHIIRELKSVNYDVELDVFGEWVQPLSQNVTFTNIIGYLNPNAKNYLALACHYDSKYFPGKVFYGAIDSAVPCAVMLNTIRTLNPLLSKLKNRNDVSLMLIFFDGEEAFKDWTQTDSLYGSRHLAKTWKNSGKIDQIEALVLLDLIGAPNSQFSSFYENTDVLHDRLVQIEKSLQTKKHLTGRKQMFLARTNYAAVDDDHRPFLENKVPVLHLIATPFPKVWHKLSDNKENLDMNSIKNFLKVMRVFVIDYFKIHETSTSFRFQNFF